VKGFLVKSEGVLVSDGISNGNPPVVLHYEGDPEVTKGEN
jgi:hypothetical protein